MPLIYSNGPAKDYVKKAFQQLLNEGNAFYLAAPYFTDYADIVAAAKKGHHIDLLIGLNPSTSPQAISKAMQEPNIALRYYTDRFHPKIFLSDTAAILGSANLTDGGMISNREATCVFAPLEDGAKIDELRTLFAELWGAASVLTETVAKSFAEIHAVIQSRGQDPDAEVKAALGKVQPPNVLVGSGVKSEKRLFVHDLQQRFQSYRRAFAEVRQFLTERAYQRAELATLNDDAQTNRFLNWVRLEKAPGTEWQGAALLQDSTLRQARLEPLGREWTAATNNRVPEVFVPWLTRVKEVFGTKEHLEEASKDDLTQGLMSLHAFTEQSRFVTGGMVNLARAFWQDDNNSTERVRATLLHLIYGPGNFVERLHDVAYDPHYKLGMFGIFCALELMGTVRPDISPPINGRMAKALRFLGYDVRAS